MRVIKSLNAPCTSANPGVYLFQCQPTLPPCGRASAPAGVAVDEPHGAAGTHVPRGLLRRSKLCNLMACESAVSPCGARLTTCAAARSVPAWCGRLRSGSVTACQHTPKPPESRCATLQLGSPGPHPPAARRRLRTRVAPPSHSDLKSSKRTR